MSLVFVGLGFLGFFAATMLAIDVGMLMTARSQAQNSADAGAHAGAVALAFDDFDDRSPSGPAVTNAIARAKQNNVMWESPDVDPEDVQFFQNESGLWNQVEVTVHRTTARGNPIDLFIAPIFGIATADIHARARAEASPANMADCMLPFMIPDRWIEKTDEPFDSLTSTYDLWDGNPIHKVPLTPKQDQYVRPGQPGYVGYCGMRPPESPDCVLVEDIGTEIRLKTSNETKASPSVYQPIVLPGNGRGADEFRAAIAGCFHADMEIGEDITVETGNMVGPTSQGIADLVAQDPDAYWDETCDNGKGCVMGSKFPVSPRVRPIPLYDPDYYERNKQNGRNADYRIANILGVFVEPMQGNEVVAHITNITGKRSSSGSAPAGAFPWAIRIIK